MDGQGLRQDAITCSSLISALAKGKQWVLALQVPRGPPLACCVRTCVCDIPDLHLSGASCLPFCGCCSAHATVEAPIQGRQTDLSQLLRLLNTQVLLRCLMTCKHVEC